MEFSQEGQIPSPDTVVENGGDLIDDLPKPLAVLRYTSSDAEYASKECVYYILGTAHVSKESCEDTAALIRKVQPDIVFIELCCERQAVLQMHHLKEPILSDIVKELRKGRVTLFQAVYGWLLGRVGAGLDVAPGEEFRVAVKEAHAVGARVVLGDRPLSITLARLWAALSLWEKWRLLTSLLWQGVAVLDKDEMRKEIEKMKETDVLTEAVKEVGREFPSLLGPLLTERDQYMTYILRRIASQGHTVVGVVGAGHLEGIRENWTKEFDVSSICSIPTASKKLSRSLKVGSLLVVALTGATVLYGVARWRRH